MAYIDHRVRSGRGLWVVRWGRKPVKSRTFHHEGEALAFKESVEAEERDATITLRAQPIDPKTGEAHAGTVRFLQHAAEHSFGKAKGKARRIEPQVAPTLSAYFQSIMQADGSLRASTVRSQRGAFASWVKPHGIAGMPLDRITPEDVRHWYGEVQAKGIGRGVLAEALKVVSKTLNAAVDEGIIPSSPLKRSRVKAPRRDKPEVEPLTVDQIERLIGACRTERDRLIVATMAYAGLRAGELGGLDKSDVDVPRCTVRVRQQALQDGTVGPVKTKAGRRTIPVPCSLAKDLGAYIEALPEQQTMLFRTSQGNRYANGTLGWLLGDVSRRAGLGHVKPHALRHSFASLAIQAGTNPRLLQAILGHSDIKETLGTYAHLYADQDSGLGDKLELLRQGNGKG
jgi:integrase